MIGIVPADRSTRGGVFSRRRSERLANPVSRRPVFRHLTMRPIAAYFPRIFSISATAIRSHSSFSGWPEWPKTCS